MKGARERRSRKALEKEISKWPTLLIQLFGKDQYFVSLYPFMTLRAITLSLPALYTLFTLAVRWELSPQCARCNIAPAIINMVRVHSDKSVPRHPPRPTTVDSANPSRNNIQHDILTSSAAAAEEPTDGTRNGEGAGAPTQERRSNRQKRPCQRQHGHTRRQFSARERLDVAAVRKVGACEVCRRKKTKVSPVMVDH